VAVLSAGIRAGIDELLVRAAPSPKPAKKAGAKKTAVAERTVARKAVKRPADAPAPPTG
jgi:hypothetical protein